MLAIAAGHGKSLGEMIDRRQAGSVRKSVNLVAVFSVEPAEYSVIRRLHSLIADKHVVRGPEGWAVLHDCCAKADLLLMAVCDDTDRLLSAIEVQNQPDERPPYNLTPHELRLLGLMAEGHSYKSAAGKLRVSVNTVAFHTQKIYAKLNVHTKAEAVARVLNEGLLQDQT